MGVLRDALAGFGAIAIVTIMLMVASVEDPLVAAGVVMFYGFMGYACYRLAMYACAGFSKST
jgi:hypothetical protein